MKRKLKKKKTKFEPVTLSWQQGTRSVHVVSKTLAVYKQVKKELWRFFEEEHIKLNGKGGR